MTYILPTIFASSFLITLSGAMMPGPLLTVTISESVHRGGKTGPLVILGHGLLELLLIAGLIAGLAPLLSLPQVFIVISIAGAMVLLWMAVSMLRTLPGLRLITEGDEAGGRKNLVLTGAVLSLINPYWLIWWITIGLGYIVQTFRFGVMGIAVFFLGHIIADLAWYALVSNAVARGRRLLRDTHYRCLVGGCAVFLLVFSGYFFYSGVDKLLHTPLFAS